MARKIPASRVKKDETSHSDRPWNRYGPNPTATKQMKRILKRTGDKNGPILTQRDCFYLFGRKTFPAPKKYAGRKRSTKRYRDEEERRAEEKAYDRARRRHANDVVVRAREAFRELGEVAWHMDNEWLRRVLVEPSWESRPALKGTEYEEQRHPTIPLAVLLAYAIGRFALEPLEDPKTGRIAGTVIEHFVSAMNAGLLYQSHGDLAAPGRSVIFQSTGLTKPQVTARKKREEDLAYLKDVFELEGKRKK